MKRRFPSASLIAVLIVYLAAPLLHAGRRVPAPSFAILSWNLQTFGNVSEARQAACRQAYGAVIHPDVYVMTYQEVANVTGINIFQKLLPPIKPGWEVSFEDTVDSQDNGILFRVGRATMTSDGFLFAESGAPDTSLALHPFRVAHLKVGAFDFTLVSLHLTFHAGNAMESKRELWSVLDWLETYLKNPKNDPDVIVAGDFNLPSEAGKKRSVKAGKTGWPTINSIIREHGGFVGPTALTVVIDEPTSRSNKRPANNYDHFILTPGAKRAFIRAERVPIANVDGADRGRKVQVSDHYPVEAWFRSN